MSQITANNVSTTLEEKVKQYISKRSTHIQILTPSHNSQCYTDYIVSLIETIELCRRYNIQLSYQFLSNQSIITEARNTMVAKAMADPSITHMMFIDADIAWNPDDVLKLLTDNQMIIGGIYGRKSFHWDLLEKNPNYISDCISKRQTHTNIVEKRSNTDIIQSRLLDYLYQTETSTNTLQIENNIVKVKGIPTGFMMIQRQAITAMQNAFPSSFYQYNNTFHSSQITEEEKKNLYALFETGISNNHYIGEDYCFCERWINMGGSIYANVTINLDHIGTHKFKGSFLESII
jgi:hypothetical protein